MIYQPQQAVDPAIFQAGMVQPPAYGPGPPAEPPGYSQAVDPPPYSACNNSDIIYAGAHGGGQNKPPKTLKF